jgi:hypothetical protein
MSFRIKEGKGALGGCKQQYTHTGARKMLTNVCDRKFKCYVLDFLCSLYFENTFNEK